MRVKVRKHLKQRLGKFGVMNDVHIQLDEAWIVFLLVPPHSYG